MPRPKSAIPKYRYHISGQAVVSFNGTDFYLGTYDSVESRAKYAALLAEYTANGMQTPDKAQHQGPAPITVRCVTAEWRQEMNVRFATKPKEVSKFSSLCELLESEYGDVPVSEFGPRKLSRVRDLFVASGNSRRYVNELVRRIIRIVKFGVSRELVPSTVLLALNSLDPLRQGQTTAKEPDPIEPVDLEIVRKTAERLSPTLRAMVAVQVSTGMRPSEVCNMRPCDIDQSGDEWVYRPEKHKTAHRGKKKAVPILGDARIAIEPFMDRDAEAYLFSPIESKKWYQQQRSAKRKTPLQYGDRPGHKRSGLKGENAKRKPREKYDKDSYRKSLQSAADKAGVPRWRPYALRHTAATVVRDALGVEAAQALLGHSRAAVTEIYAKVSEAKAIEAAREAPRLKLFDDPEKDSA